MPEHSLGILPATTARTDVVVAMSLDVKLTADQLAALSDEQTTLLFKAIKTIATLTETARTKAKGAAA